MLRREGVGALVLLVSLIQSTGHTVLADPILPRTWRSSPMMMAETSTRVRGCAPPTAAMR